MSLGEYSAADPYLRYYMEEDQDFDYFAGNSVGGSDDGDEIRSPTPVRSWDEERENERYNSFSHSASSDDGEKIYGDERFKPDGVPSSSKRRKVPREDRISDLPDSVIHHILSFLPAEDAVKTGVLSKRWMYLWTSVPKLTFRQRPRRRYHQRFLRFVDETLFFYSSSKMDKFELHFDYDYIMGKENHLNSLIHKWLRLVTRHDTEELSLKFCEYRTWRFCNGDRRYPIPQFVFNSSSLTKLSTRLCDYAPKGQVCWRSLRVLTIEHADLSNDVLQTIFLGSPMLEYMELHYCRGMTNIDISSSSALEYLEVHNCWPITRVDISSRSRLEKLALKDMRKDMWNPENEEENDVVEIMCPNLK